MALINRDRLVCIGRVRDAHGLQGELKVLSVTDDPAYYLKCREVILDGGRGLLTCEVQSIRLHQTGWIMALAGIESREAAQECKSGEVLLAEEDVKPLAEGEYFLDDLIGCSVVGADGIELGRVTGLIETGANDVMEVRGAGGEFLVPMIDEVVKEVDSRARRIRIEPLPGMFDTP